MCQECVKNVYLHDNRIFLFFLQLHCQFHHFSAISEPGNVPDPDSMGNNYKEFEEVVNWLEERAHCGHWGCFLTRIKERVKTLP